MKIKYYIKEMRVHHYIKNLLIFAPLVCSGMIADTGRLICTAWAFVSFCLTASAVYIINDIRDIGKDRQNRFKRGRPLAAGEISVKGAVIFSAALVLAGAAICFFLCPMPQSLLVPGVYLLLNILYSFWLKNVPLADIVILVSGFLLRLYFGSAVTGIEISNWLYLVVLSSAFFLGLGKRRNELKYQCGEDVRKVLDKYTLSFLEKNMYVCMTLTIVFYTLWTTDSHTVEMYGSNALVWTVPVVIVIFMKYSLDTEKSENADPVSIFLHDKALMILCLLYVSAVMLLLYLI